MRRTRKKPMTARARQMIVKALDGMRAKGIDIAAVLDASTKNCWTDVYEPKPKPGAEQAAKSIEKSPKWATDAGFPTVWEAENALCFERNAHEFRDGKRIEASDMPLGATKTPPTGKTLDLLGVGSHAAQKCVVVGVL